VQPTTAYNYFYKQSKQYWNQSFTYLKAMLGAVLYRGSDKAFAMETIFPSLLENAVEDSAKGMYWKNNNWGYYWYQSPIEQQSLLIDLFNEAALQQNNKALKEKVSDMQTWLLLHKQTNNWQTTKATADACFALIEDNSHLAETPVQVSLQLGDSSFTSSQNDEASTGYFKKTIEGKNVQSSMGNITVAIHADTQHPLPSWGAVYWQYFEENDKITAATSPLSLSRKLFIEKKY